MSKEKAIEWIDRAQESLYYVVEINKKGYFPGENDLYKAHKYLNAAKEELYDQQG